MKILISKECLKSLSRVVDPNPIVIQVVLPRKSQDGARAIADLLYNMQMMGNFGSSRSIKIEDWASPEEKDTKTHNLQNSFSFDGDGTDFILSLKVDGKKYKS